jgi:hypothetical protein
MYAWMLYLHIAGTFGFLLAHGASASVSYALRRERSPERIRTLLELSAGTYRVMYPALLLLLISGIVAGFQGRWWRYGWIWTSLALLIAIVVAMSVLGSRFYGQARKAAGMPYYEKGKTQPPVEPLSQAEIEAILEQANPHLLTLIGFGGILLIAWLMMFKPF